MSIKTHTSNGVATIEMARPEKKNALTQAMYQAMADAINAARADDAVYSVLIVGQPEVFCSGNDLDDFMRHPPGGEDAAAFRFMRALLACEKPVIAGVTGAAIGIGATLLLHCDLVYVSETTRLHMPFVALGLVPEFASSLLLPQLMGQARAAEKLLLGEPITASEAVAFGIANAVLPAAEVLPQARRAAERFKMLPVGAVRDTKRLLRMGTQERVAQTMQTEIEIFAQRLCSPEAKEAFAAFFEKRKPDFGPH